VLQENTALSYEISLDSFIKSEFAGQFDILITDIPLTNPLNVKGELSIEVGYGYKSPKCMSSGGGGWVGGTVNLNVHMMCGAGG